MRAVRCMAAFAAGPKALPVSPLRRRGFGSGAASGCRVKAFHASRKCCLSVALVIVRFLLPLAVSLTAGVLSVSLAFPFALVAVALPLGRGWGDAATNQ